MKKGQCNVSVASLLKEPYQEAPMISQFLFGETFSLDSKANGFSLVISDYDETKGWISDLQFDEIQNTDEKFLVQESFMIYEKQLISLGSELLKSDLNEISIDENIEETAKRFLNVPYLQGGRSLFGVDAAAFVQLVFKAHHKQLPRLAKNQAEMGESLAFIWEAEAGDLAFFDDENGEIIHVGIMLNNEEIIHAYGKVRIDTIDSMGIFNKKLNKHTHKLRFIKRL